MNDQKQGAELAKDWAAFCDRMKAVGEQILGPEFPDTPHSHAEGFRHLGRLTVYALQLSLDFSQRQFPAFYRFDDDSVKWGGPNSDNHYQRARIDPTGTYRVTGNVTGLREMIISTPEGDMQLGQMRIFEERVLSELEVADDGELEIIISPERHSGNWIPLHPEADHVLVRQYVSDWVNDPVVQLRIERVGAEGLAPPLLEPNHVAMAFDEAADWVEKSIPYWKGWMDRARTALPANKMNAPRAQPGGAPDILYGGGWWNLADDEALVIDCEAPTARYWSIQLYSYPWFESLDFGNRVNSLTGHQMQVDDDGRFRVVVSHRDPGVPNWLDTEGRLEGLVTYRWVFSSTQPAPTSSVVDLADLRDVLPEQTPYFNAEDRRKQIADRQAAVARRFRT